MNRIVLQVAVACALVLSGMGGVWAQEKHAITFDDMIKLHRVSEPQVSPDGKWVVYTVATPDMEANRNASNIWIVPTTGGSATQLTQSGHDSSPVWPPDGKTIAFTSSVYPDCKDDACNKSRDEEKEKSKMKAHVAEHLLYRHWTHWNEGKRSHLFVIPVDGRASRRDLTAGADYDVPPDERGGPGDINFSPDGKEICFTAVTDKMEAISTNGDLFVVPVSGGEAKRITTQPGFDGNPVYSPDGKYIAYHAQLTAAYEADRWRVMLYGRATGKSENLTETSFDRSAANLAWSTDSAKIYFNAENETLDPIYEMAPKVGAVPKKLIDGYNGAVSMSADGKTLAFTRTSLTMPAEVFTAASDGTGLKQVTHQNDAALAKIEMNAPEKFWFEGAEMGKVHAMLVKPPKFDATKKYPLLVLLHGGPQTMWGDSWGYRWNAQVFSGAGYVTLLINRRGSTGFGQKFTDEITNDWGGKPYVEVMKGGDGALAKYPFIDGKRMAAAGGSYGGGKADRNCNHKGRVQAISRQASQ